jgi:hypothetical protein
MRQAQRSARPPGSLDSSTPSPLMWAITNTRGVAAQDGAHLLAGQGEVTTDARRRCLDRHAVRPLSLVARAPGRGGSALYVAALQQVAVDPALLAR